MLGKHIFTFCEKIRRYDILNEIDSVFSFFTLKNCKSTINFAKKKNLNSLLCKNDDEILKLRIFDFKTIVIMSEEKNGK